MRKVTKIISILLFIIFCIGTYTFKDKSNFFNTQTTAFWTADNLKNFTFMSNLIFMLTGIITLLLVILFIIIAFKRKNNYLKIKEKSEQTSYELKQTAMVDSEWREYDLINVAQDIFCIIHNARINMDISTLKEYSHPNYHSQWEEQLEIMREIKDGNGYVGKIKAKKTLIVDFKDFYGKDDDSFMVYFDVRGFTQCVSAEIISCNTRYMKQTQIRRRTQIIPGVPIYLRTNSHETREVQNLICILGEFWVFKMYNGKWVLLNVITEDEYNKQLLNK